jgi:hypothetical protein
MGAALIGDAGSFEKLRGVLGAQLFHPDRTLPSETLKVEGWKSERSSCALKEVT